MTHYLKLLAIFSGPQLQIAEVVNGYLSDVLYRAEVPKKEAVMWESGDLNFRSPNKISEDCTMATSVASIGRETELEWP